MDDQQIQILQRLAEGIDPVTGEVFPADSPYQRPEIIRALYAAARAPAAGGNPPRQPNRSSPQAPRAGKPWTKEEEKRLLARFDAGEDAAEIARHLERTKVAITARLVKLGRMEPPPDLVLRGPVAARA